MQKDEVVEWGREWKEVKERLGSLDNNNLRLKYTLVKEFIICKTPVGLREFSIVRN